MKRGDRVFHCKSGETFTVTRVLPDRLVSSGKSFPIAECEAVQATLSAADVETLVAIVAAGIELGDSEVLVMLNELELEAKTELWIKRLNVEQRSALSALKEQQARSEVAA
jgi:hypothetical protein